MTTAQRAAIVQCSRCRKPVDPKRLHTFTCRSCHVRAPMCASCWNTSQERDRGMCYECKDAQPEMML